MMLAVFLCIGINILPLITNRLTRLLYIGRSYLGILLLF